MAELDIPDRAIDAAGGKYDQQMANSISTTLHIAGPIVVAAELRRLYDEMPVADRWFLVDRADELDLEGNTP